MSLNKAPKFGKVELLLKSKNKDTVASSITRVEFEDCGLMITGDYLIVITDEKDELKTTLTSTGKIFHMSEIEAYKTHSI
jgi:hypothetical protein